MKKGADLTTQAVSSLLDEGYLAKDMVHKNSKIIGAKEMTRKFTEQIRFLSV